LIVKVAEDILGFEVIGQSGDGMHGLDLCRKTNPQLVLMDITIPELDGIELSKILLREKPEMRILALSSEYDQYTLFRLFQAGIHGYVDKLTSSIDVLRDAIATVAGGKAYFSDLALKVKMEMQTDPSSFAKVLSDREVEMMQLFARGFSNVEIAERLAISPLTVQSHRRSVMKKLDLHSVKQLMRYAVEKGFWHAYATVLD
jgi:DNA-binding NarL/FixJ family response regulator